jgi:nicotinate-nucleotide pyrophosphorylase (carboxylating)
MLNLKKLEPLIKRALREDIGRGDITTNLLIPKDKKVKAVIQAKEEGVIAGLEVAAKVFKLIDKRIQFKATSSEGKRVKPGKIIAKLRGNARSILSAERTALNFLQRLSGIATLTDKYVNLIKPFKTGIMDTRKTTPGLRALEKYAVRAGGGYNHRMGLFDMVLIKDSHIKVQGQNIKRLVESAKRKVRQSLPLRGAKQRSNQIKVEVETENLKEVAQAVQAGADIIMLDNMSLSQTRKAVKLVKSLSPKGKKRPLLEASGGVNLNNVRKIAASGVDMISLGALTHSSRALDISLEIEH